MLPRQHPDRIRVSSDEHRLVANADLILPPPRPCALACLNWSRSTSIWAIVNGGVKVGRAGGRLLSIGCRSSAKMYHHRGHWPA